MSEIESLSKQALADIAAASSPDALEQLRVGLLGKHGSITAQLKALGTLPADQRKAAGEEDVIATPEPQEEKVVDLMAALEASVAAAKQARKRHPTAASPGTVSGDEIAGVEATADEVPADEDAARTA